MQVLHIDLVTLPSSRSHTRAQTQTYTHTPTHTHTRRVVGRVQSYLGSGLGAHVGGECRERWAARKMVERAKKRKRTRKKDARLKKRERETEKEKSSEVEARQSTWVRTAPLSPELPQDARLAARLAPARRAFWARNRQRSAELWRPESGERWRAMAGGGGHSPAHLSPWASAATRAPDPDPTRLRQGRTHLSYCVSIDCLGSGCNPYSSGWWGQRRRDETASGRSGGGETPLKVGELEGSSEEPAPSALLRKTPRGSRH